MIKKSAPALAIVTLLLPGVATAHSALESSAPADGAAVAGPVAQVEMTFGGGIRLTRVEVEGPDGTVELDVEEPMGTEFAFPADLDQGVYEVSWIGLGPDGHPMKGAFGFEVE